MGGVPCIRGLRIPVATVVRMIANGMMRAEIAEDLPPLEVARVRIGPTAIPDRRWSPLGQTTSVSSFLIVTGPPGAGKSSVARILTDTTRHSVLIEGDVFFRFLANGALDPWLPESHEQNTVVTRAAGRAAGEFSRGGYATVYDGVIGPWFLNTFATTAGLAVVDYVVLLPPVETCQHRVATRQGHGFTDQDATIHMHAQFALSDIADRHVISDPHGTPTAISAAIRTAQNRGELRYTVP